MFRTLSHIIIAFLVLSTTTGFSISKHYCSNNLVSITINHEAESCCDMDDCCHNETNHYQLEDNFVFSYVITDVDIQTIDILFPVIFTILNVETEIDSFSENIFSELPLPQNIQTVLSLFQTYLC
jgi:hypothetical protein